jgi:hypothetical protein
MHRRCVHALPHALAFAAATAVSGCAGNLPRLCLNPHDVGHWSPMAAPPEAASALEDMAKASPHGFSGQPIQPHRHSYWYSDAEGEVLLCHQEPGASDYCFSETWIFVQRDGQWRIRDASWNLHRIEDDPGA